MQDLVGIRVHSVLFKSIVSFLEMILPSYCSVDPCQEMSSTSAGSVDPPRLLNEEKVMIDDVFLPLPAIDFLWHLCVLSLNEQV